MVDNSDQRLSALHQLHLQNRLNTWLQWIGQRQLQYQTDRGELLLSAYGLPLCQSRCDPSAASWLDLNHSKNRYNCTGFKVMFIVVRCFTKAIYPMLTTYIWAYCVLVWWKLVRLTVIMVLIHVNLYFFLVFPHKIIPIKLFYVYKYSPGLCYIVPSYKIHNQTLSTWRRRVFFTMNIPFI